MKLFISKQEGLPHSFNTFLIEKEIKRLIYLKTESENSIVRVLQCAVIRATYTLSSNNAPPIILSMSSQHPGTIALNCVC